MTDYFDARLIADALGGEIVGPNQVRAPGPGHSKKDRSLSLKIEPSAPYGLLIHSFSGDDFQTCLSYIQSALGISCNAEAFASVLEGPTHRYSSTDAALRLWNEAEDARGTLTERYLRSRGLSLMEEARSAIRFHPKCPFGPRTIRPCIVALYRDISSDEPKALLRTALDPDGSKIDRKVIGPKRGCAIKLSGLVDVSQGLTIGEGVETTIGGIAKGFGPAWAVGDAGEMARFPVLPGIKSLTILVDNDASGTGNAAAIECTHRWVSAGVPVKRVIPTELGADMADVAARAVS